LQILERWFKSNEPLKKPLILCWFLHENHWFLESFQITGTGASFDVKILKTPEPEVV
jgi:hypothetical protein